MIVNASPSYFNFNSSDESVATVDENGFVSVVGSSGTAIITATLGNNDSQGSLTLNSQGSFVNAPDPTLPQSDVISIYSDAYSSVNNLNLAAFNNGGINISTQTFLNNNSIIYENLGFVGLDWDGTLDVSGKTHVHIDAQLTSGAGSTLVVELIDFGPNGTSDGFGGTDDSAGGFNASSQLVNGNWVGIDIPLNAFTLPTGGGGSGNPNLNNIGFFVLVSNGGDFIVDNIYFY